MLNQRVTGLNNQQFTTLLKDLTYCIAWVKPAEKPRKLTLAQGLKAPMLNHRHNFTEELPADIFDVSQST